MHIEKAYLKFGKLTREQRNEEIISLEGPKRRIRIMANISFLAI